VVPDPSLRRVERASVIVCVAMAAIAWAVAGRAAALGVVCGGLLAGFSYSTIRLSATALTTRLIGSAEGASGPPETRRGSARILVRAASRYALLALLSYVMIARLRLHPLGLLAGASSVVAAIGIEAVRLTVHKP
jgi:hypothetical protein